MNAGSPARMPRKRTRTRQSIQDEHNHSPPSKKPKSNYSHTSPRTGLRASRSNNSHTSPSGSAVEIPVSLHEQQNYGVESSGTETSRPEAYDIESAIDDGASPIGSTAAATGSEQQSTAVAKPNIGWTDWIKPAPVKRDEKDLIVPAGAEKPTVQARWQRAIKRAEDMFKYTNIEEDQTRLLILLGGSWDEEINAVLITVDDDRLGKTHSYGALSYHWGEGNEDSSIIMLQSLWQQPIRKVFEEVRGMQSFEGLRAKRLWIKSNLYEALKRLRKPDRNVPLWVDALCINQPYAKEKAIQVGKMDRIYRAASNVCVWLGPGNPQSEQAMAFIKEIVNLKDLKDLLENTKHIPRWASLYHLLRWSWFSRRWVIQELALAKQATVHCGPTEVHWDDFRDAIGIFHRYFPSLRTKLADSRYSKSPINDLEPLGGKLLVDVSSNILRRNRDGSFDSVKSLEWLVSFLSAFDCSDPRDSINALRNISKEMNPSSRATGIGGPDYSKDLFEVYRDFVDWTITTSKSLDIICRHWALPERDKPGGPATEHAPRIVKLPSWILTADQGSFGLGGNAFRGRRGAESLVGLPHKSPYKADGGQEPQFEFPSSTLHGSSVQASTPAARTSKYELRVRGLEIGTVKAAHQVLDGSIPEDGLKKLGWSPQPKETEISRAPDRLWRTLVADRGPQGAEVPVYYHRACLYCLLNRTENGHINIEKLLKNKDFEDQQSIVQDFLERVRAVTWNRVILQGTPPPSKEATIAEERGGIIENLVGLGPSNTQIDDVIAILYGCSVPVILRPHYKNPGKPGLHKKIEYYEFIGEAFIYGKMDGEALVDAHLRGKFHLR